MMFSNADLNLCMESQENEVLILIIEDPVTLRNVIEELLAQCSGDFGKFTLLCDDNVVSFVSQVSLILNPFCIDINEKKIHSKLFRELEMHVKEGLIDETQVLTSEIFKFLDKVLLYEPYPINYDLDLNITGLLKLFNVSLEHNGINMLERLMSYIGILSSLCNVPVFILYNLKEIFSENEVKQFYEFIFYSKINVLVVESTQRYQFSCEKTTLIDKDRCLIQY